MSVECLLCRVIRQPDDTVYYMDDRWLVIKTKRMKGHSTRFQIIYRWHVEDIPPELKWEALGILFRLCVQHMGAKFTIMSDKYSTIRGHWHCVASTLDEGDDQEQIKATPRWEIRWMP